MLRLQCENINTVEYWDHRYSCEVEEMWTIWSTEDLVSRLSNFIPVNSHVLDAGIGAGIIPYRLRKMRPDIRFSGCDFSSSSIRYCQRLMEFENLFVADITQPLPCPDNSFDAVICTEVLEHLEDPKAVVSNLVRVAKGVLAVTTPNWSAIESQEHIMMFTDKDLAEILSPYGDVQIITVRDGRNLMGVCKCKLS